VCVGGRRNAWRVLVGKPEAKRTLGRPRCRWGENIKMDIHETGWGTWSGLIWLNIGRCS